MLAALLHCKFVEWPEATGSKVVQPLLDALNRFRAVLGLPFQRIHQNGGGNRLGILLFASRTLSQALL